MTEPLISSQDVDHHYERLISSAEWEDALSSLNAFLAKSLEDAGKPVRLNGNLFYGHNRTNWAQESYVPAFDMKRRNFFAMATQSKSLLEISVNGGHSLLLALMANPNLEVYGIDVCERLGRDWSHVEVYVPAAFTWLQYHFPGRTKFIRGNSLVEVPKLSLERPDLRFGMYHLDGSKFTHLQEVVSAYHILEDNALIVHDDSNLGPVKRGDRKLRLIGLTREFEQENIGLRLTDHHRIRQKQAGATWV